MSTLKTTNLQNASAASPAIVLAADGSATANLSSVNGGPIAGSRNRIINGDMRIDQRNAGASVSTIAGNKYTLDRWQAYASQASKFTVQQNAGSVTPPAGFTNYLGVTSSSAYTLGAGEEFEVYQIIEGYNAADFDWGLAAAQTVVLSFWVRSSLTGTFGGSIQNGTSNRSYPFSYSILSANAWEKKTIVILGDTSGSYNTAALAGIQVYFSLGAGTALQGTAGAWVTGNKNTATGATSVVGTNGATFYITGVQLEPGSTATPFERRSYGQELSLCQRYFWTSPNAYLPSGNALYIVWSSQMRTTPTVSTSVGGPTFFNTSNVGVVAGSSSNGTGLLTASAEL